MFVSKYLALDPEFGNALGCVRHELAHALADRRAWITVSSLRACETLDVPAAWREEKTGRFNPARLMWAKCGGGNVARKSEVLPELLFERNVWDAPVNGNRTVFKDDESAVLTRSRCTIWCAPRRRAQSDDGGRFCNCIGFCLSNARSRNTARRHRREART